ncbi:MAG: hypothetical protein JWP81_2515 [Ferruginibacter sp.]|nr:hypothetical protein [Ferruginibacter sp.]
MQTGRICLRNELHGVANTWIGGGLAKLTFMDYTFRNNIGLYACSPVITFQQAKVQILPNPPEEYASE